MNNLTYKEQLANTICKNIFSTSNSSELSKLERAFFKHFSDFVIRFQRDNYETKLLVYRESNEEITYLRKQRSTLFRFLTLECDVNLLESLVYVII